MTVKIYRCAICNRKLPKGKWIVGKDRRITGGIPRYCWPGEGCAKTNPKSGIRKESR
jgi:hypothetical protein